MGIFFLQKIEVTTSSSEGDILLAFTSSEMGHESIGHKGCLAVSFVPCLLLDRTKCHNSDEVFLGQNSKDNDGNNHNDGGGRHFSPQKSSVGLELRYENRYGSCVNHREDKRKNELVPAQDRTKYDGCDEARHAEWQCNMVKGTHWTTTVG